MKRLKTSQKESNTKLQNKSESSTQNLHNSGENNKKYNNQDSTTSIFKSQSYGNASKTLNNSPYALNLNNSQTNSKLEYDEDFINKSTERMKQINPNTKNKKI